MRSDRLADGDARGEAWLPSAIGVIAIGVLVRFLYLQNRPDVAVSIDAAHWYEVAVMLMRGQNPYALTDYLNWPPVWPACLWLIMKASIALQVPFVTVLFGFLMAVEAAAILALFRLFAAFGRSGTVPILVGVALNPAMVFQVAQHGSFDVLMMTWVMLALGRFLRFRESRRDADWFWGCAWLGLGVVTKTVPLTLLPVAVLAARPIGLGKALAGAALAATPMLLAVGAIFATAPQAVWENVIGYRSMSGWYGITALMEMAGWSRPTIRIYASLFAAALLVWQAAGLLLLRRGEPVEARAVILVAGLVMLALPTLGSGYGSQYVWWYWPTLLLSFVLYRSPWWRALLAIAGVVLVVTFFVEYLAFRNHGGWLFDASKDTFAKKHVQAMVRMPLFVASLATLVGGAVLLARSRRHAEKGVAMVEP